MIQLVLYSSIEDLKHILDEAILGEQPCLDKLDMRSKNSQQFFLLAWLDFGVYILRDKGVARLSQL